jgi:Ca-activated chloride channel family protein
MIGFSWGLALLGLVLVPVLLVFYARALSRSGGGVAVHPDLEFLRSLKPSRFARGRDLGAVFFTLALALGVVALARPTAPLPVLDNRTTVMMAVDVSGSMRNNDIEPSRFVAMQTAAKDFARKLPPEINLGLVSFAGTAALNVAPSLERQPILDAIDGLFMARGTAIGAGLREAITVLPGRTVDEKATKPLEENPPPAIVVLLTDGRNNRDVDPLEMARLAKVQQVRVYTIGLGTMESNASGSSFLGFDPTVLQEMAKITDGTYFEARSATQLGSAYAALGSRLGWTVKRGEVTHVVAACAGVLLLLALLIGERSRRVV